MKYQKLENKFRKNKSDTFSFTTTQVNVLSCKYVIAVVSWNQLLKKCITLGHTNKTRRQYYPSEVPCDFFQHQELNLNKNRNIATCQPVFVTVLPYVYSFSISMPLLTCRHHFVLLRYIRLYSSLLDFQVKSLRIHQNRVYSLFRESQRLWLWYQWSFFIRDMYFRDHDVPKIKIYWSNYSKNNRIFCSEFTLQVLS